MWCADLCGEIREGGDIVAQGGRVMGEPVTGQLHTIAGIPCEADDHAIDRCGPVPLCSSFVEWICAGGRRPAGGCWGSRGGAACVRSDRQPPTDYLSRQRHRTGAAVGGQLSWRGGCVTMSIRAGVSDARRRCARPMIDWFGDGSVVVVDLAMACCAIESEFAVPAGALRRGDVPDGARVVVVVSGTVTDVLAPEVAAVIAGLPEPHVVSFGSCACAGGPYWDAYCVTKGIDQWVSGRHLCARMPAAPRRTRRGGRAVRAGCPPRRTCRPRAEAGDEVRGSRRRRHRVPGRAAAVARADRRSSRRRLRVPAQSRSG